MKNYLMNSTLKSRYSKYSFARGGPIPHHDPPDFKPKKVSRIISVNEHLLWFRSGYSLEYIVNLKHNYVRGLSGSFMQILRSFILGLIVPVSIVAILKSKSQNNRGYYRDQLSRMGNELTNSTETEYFYGKLRTLHSMEGHGDVLGRRNHEFYYSLYPFRIIPDRKNQADRWIERLKECLEK